MTKFSEIANAYRKSLEDDDQDLKSLRGTALTLRKEFAKYLGLSETNSNLIDVQNQPAVAIGVLDEQGRFKSVTRTAFPRVSSSQIQFVIRLNFDPDSIGLEQGILLFQLHMERSEAGVTVFLDDETSFDVGIYDMHPLFDEMFNRAIAKESPNKSRLCENRLTT
ncbi:hypothetical protein AL053_05195 [Pseudomonas savastanoi pv. fraxini]|uniref:hypothetical protein n=2 Tax=Pseudomonas savastanoi TaxID=29438 RepID=UPI0007602F62|nr:hypothetical protein [Pseudomonas savastanoi]KWS66619.1 hypothetical protein AL053_05195 [Pseudomonas savastanoi pv. fraxini]